MSSSLLQSILDNQYNPIGMQRVILDNLVTTTNGDITVVDTTNPVMFTLNSATQLVAAFMEKNEANSRKQYSSLAQTVEELYHHMSDQDYINRFAMPSRTKITVALTLQELQTKLVLDNETGVMKIVIPRNSTFTVAGVTFSIQYPIEIRQLLHGGFHVVYDTTVSSPLQELETNLLDWKIVNYAGEDWMMIEIDVFQFKVSSFTQPLTSAAAFVLDVPISDQFYYARVYTQLDDGSWTEISTTHSDQVYDVKTPTAALKLVGNVLNVTIPQIYTNTDILTGYIRVDVYETLGGIEMSMGVYPAANYTAKWEAIDKVDNTIFVAPIRNMRSIQIFSNGTTYGGRNQLSFDELRKRVINNDTGPQVIPITPSQAQAALQDSGYEIVKNIDNLTDRVFLATRTLPKPKNEKLITAASLGIEMITTSLENALAVSTVIDNGKSVTITPDTLYESNAGIIGIVPDAKKLMLLQMPPDKRALSVTNANLYYSPFHYVLDTNKDEFDSRPYYLDGPSIVSKTFVQENDTTLMQVVVDSFSIERTVSGYKLIVMVASSDEYKALPDSEVFVQLSYVPSGERNRAYLNGTLVGVDPNSKERVFEFDLSSNMNVTADDMLQLTMFKMYTQDQILTDIPLLSTFDVVFGITQTPGTQWLPNSVDSMLGKLFLPSRVYGISHERLTVRFGYVLKALWSKSRSVASTITYETYPDDVPLLYQSDIYEIDPATGSAITIDDDGEIHYNILHNKGDPVLNADGAPMVKYRKGDVIISAATGRPVIHAPRTILRQFSLMLVEGAYWFATDSTSVAYRSEINDTVINWLTNDLTSIQKRLLEKTRLYFYPKASLGEIQVMVGSGQLNRIQAGQAFQVLLTVSGAVYTNPKLRIQLEKTTVQVISESLKQETVSISQIISQLREQYGSDVIDVRISGLGGAANYPALTVVDGASRCSLRKRLVAQGDASLIVEEDVTITFVKHELS